MTDTQGAVKLAEIVKYNHDTASIKGQHHPPLNYDTAAYLAQAVLTLTAQLQAANEKVALAQAETAVLLPYLIVKELRHPGKDRAATMYEKCKVCGRGWLDGEMPVHNADCDLANKAHLATALLSQIAALKEGLRPFAEMYRRVAARNETWDDDWCAAEAVTCGDIRRAAAALTKDL